MGAIDGDDPCWHGDEVLVFEGDQNLDEADPTGEQHQRGEIPRSAPVSVAAA